MENELAKFLTWYIKNRFPGESPSSVARRAGITAPYLNQMLSGKRKNPSERVLRALAIAGNADPYLFIEASRGGEIFLDKLFMPRELFDFTTSNAPAWQWVLHQIENNWDNTIWREKTILALIIIDRIFYDITTMSRLKIYFTDESVEQFIEKDAMQIYKSQYNNSYLPIDKMKTLNKNDILKKINNVNTGHATEIERKTWFHAIALCCNTLEYIFNWPFAILGDQYREELIYREMAEEISAFMKEKEPK